VNDGKEVEVAPHQVMRCILCYDGVVNIHDASIKERKGLITNYITYNIIILKKHLDADHSIIVKIFEEEINNETIGMLEDNLQRKGQIFQ